MTHMLLVIIALLESMHIISSLLDRSQTLSDKKTVRFRTTSFSGSAYETTVSPCHTESHTSRRLTWCSHTSASFHFASYTLAPFYFPYLTSPTAIRIDVQAGAPYM